MAAKKLTRKELLKEPDEFITTTGRLIRFGVAHRNQIVAGAAVFFGLLVVWAVAGLVTERSENRSFAELGGIMARYESLEGEKGKAQAFEAVKKDFTGFLDRYGRKGGGRVGRVIFAGLSLQTGDHPAAVDHYKRALDDFKGHPFYENMIQTALAQAELALKNPEAAARLESVANSPVKAMPFSDAALFHLAAAAESDGQPEKAAAYYKQIAEAFPDSLLAPIVRERISG